MSGQAETRAALAAALDGVTATVDGTPVAITGYPTQPPVVEPYAAWPIWVATRPIAMCINEIDWHVAVALPGPDVQSWAAAGDELIAAVQQALSAWLVDRIEPGQLAVADVAGVPVLKFSVTT